MFDNFINCCNIVFFFYFLVSGFVLVLVLSGYYKLRNSEGMKERAAIRKQEVDVAQPPTTNVQRSGVTASPIQRTHF